jgi:hypothetical protein
MEINAFNIRAILMYYYRYKRQFNCVGEVSTDYGELADVLVMTKKHILEIEIKISKHDLIKGEARKKKHKKEDSKRHINKYFICVPTELVDVAKEWIEKTNPKYGLIEFRTAVSKQDFCKYENLIHFRHNAKLLQPKCYPITKERLIKRLSSALTNEYIGRIK